MDLLTIFKCAILISLVRRYYADTAQCLGVDSQFCIHIGAEHHSFSDAEQACVNRSMHLATITTRVRQQFILATIRNLRPQPQSVWIGLFKLRDSLYWISGYQALPDVYWTTNSKLDGAFCVALDPQVDELNTWTILPCDFKSAYICSTVPSDRPAQPEPDPTEALTCPTTDYVLAGRNCFLVKADFSDSFSWHEASEACKASTQGATLASINSAHDQDVLTVLLARRSNAVWIGLHSENGEHRWQRKEPVLYTNWKVNEPNNQYSQPSCTMVYQRLRNLGEWNDEKCEAKMGYVCQANPVASSGSHTVKSSSLLGSQGRCSPGFIEHQNACYRLHPQTSSQIEGSAQNDGLPHDLCPHRLSPLTRAEAAFMRLLLHQHLQSTSLSTSHQTDLAWIGASLLTRANDSVQKQLVTEVGLVYGLSEMVDFGDLKPDSSAVCLALNRSSTELEWIDCNSLLQSVCGYYLEGHIAHSTAQSVGSITCPPDWHPIANRCFSSLIRPAQTWSTAEQKCRSLASTITGQPDAGHLVSVHSVEEQQLLTNLVGLESAWIGLRVDHLTGFSGSAGHHDSLRLYWSDQSSVDYLAFRVGEPSRRSSSGQPEECVALRGRTHDWNDLFCEEPRTFVCQLELAALKGAQRTFADSSSGPILAPSKECSQDLHPPMCIQLHLGAKNYPDAEMACNKLSLSLATIPSQSHQQFVMNILKKVLNKPTRVYIGLLQSDGLLAWTSHYPAVAATFWKTKLQKDERSCVYIDTGVDGLNNWGTNLCDESLPYLCGDYLTADSQFTTEAPNQPLYKCPPGYIRIGRHCFMIKGSLADRLSWDDASRRCATTAPVADLASISSSFEQDALTALLGQQSVAVWIGLQIHGTEHVWQRNDSVIYTNWKAGEPSGSPIPTRLCTMMHQRLTNLGEWNDESCEQRLGYICQANPIPVEPGDTKVGPELDGLFQQGSCASGFYAYRNACYTVYGSNPELARSSVDLHDQLSAQCLQIGHLVGAPCETSKLWATAACPVPVTPHSAADAAMMRLLVHMFTSGKREAWVGLKLRRSATQHILVSEDNSTLGVSKQVDFEPIANLSFWSPSTVAAHLCLILSADQSQLTFRHCNTPGLPVVCGYYLDTHMLHPESDADASALCPKHWTAFAGHCYSPSSLTHRLTWPEAELACQQLGRSVLTSFETNQTAHLVSIHSVEQEQLINQLAPFSSIWTGLKIIYGIGSYGPFFAQHDLPSPWKLHLTWSDQTAVDYFSFDTNQLSSDESAHSVLQHCVALDEHSRIWEPTSCQQVKGYLCQLEASAFSKPRAQIQSNVNATELANSCSNVGYPFSSLLAHACYRIVPNRMNWLDARSYCYSLGPNSHLATFHSQAQFDEVSALLHGQLAHDGVWFGLFQSNFAYHSDDGRPVDWVSQSADRSKDKRQHLQDCFSLKAVAVSPWAPLSQLEWIARDCVSERLQFVCQLDMANQLKAQQPDRSPADLGPSADLKKLDCPSGFVQHEDRCFGIVEEELYWDEANRRCQQLASERPSFNGSLARIANQRDQDFISSLLVELTMLKPMAWIGLFKQPSFYSSPQYAWSDGGNITLLRPVFRDHRYAIFGQAQSTSTIRPPEQLKLCTAIYRHTNPLLNGLWVEWSCAEHFRLMPVCQLWPVPTTLSAEPQKTSTLQSVTTKQLIRSTLHYQCAPGFHLGLTGLHGHPHNIIRNITRPVCYRLLNRTEKLNWTEADQRCTELSTSEHKASLLALSSTFEASFVRAWLRQPISLGGAGLGMNELVWSGLRVTDKCPACYANWTWSSGDVVRFTDWLQSPAEIGRTPSGCYLFNPQPYADPGSRLGSLYPASGCDRRLLVVCQSLATVLKEPDTALLSRKLANSHQLLRPQCFKPPASNTDAKAVVNSTTFRTDVMHAKSGRPCVRWDLVPLNLAEDHLSQVDLRSHLLAAEWVDGENTRSYAENFCSYVFNSNHYTPLYGCYTNLSNSSFEECEMIQCGPDRSGRTNFHWLPILLLLLASLVSVGCVAIVFWRGVSPLRAGYRRHRARHSRQLLWPFRYRDLMNQAADSSLYSLPHPSDQTFDQSSLIETSLPNSSVESRRSDGRDSLLGESRKLNGTANGSVCPANISSVSVDPIDPNDPLGQTKQTAPFIVGAMSFHNPIYTPLTIPPGEEDYEPEIEA